MPGLALATAGGVWAEVRRAVHAPVPHFDDEDPCGRYGRPDGDPVRIAVLGDSSVTGPGLAHGSHSWIAQIAERLPWDVHLMSHARGGSRVRDVLEQQVGAVVETRPDLVVVSVGANDAIHVTPTRHYAHQLAELLDLLTPVAPVVALGIGDLSVIPRIPLSLRPALARRSASIDRAHATVTARREQVVRVPVSELSDPHFRLGGRSLFADDLFHPNRRGHALWAELFRPYVHDAVVQHLASSNPGTDRSNSVQLSRS